MKEKINVMSLEKTKKFFLRAMKFLIWMAFFLLVLVALLFVFFNLPGSSPREDVSFGVTFSSRFARDMGLDPRETLQALFADLGVRKVRVPVYWDTVEPSRGTYDFSDIDWQLDMARQYSADVILVTGQRVPRWPECFVPAWAANDEALRKESLVHLVQETVRRYKNHAEISTWQVENEPFLSFGICPAFDVETFDQEITMVKSIDATRPILVTDSGELSFWANAAKRGDVFGTTLYRHIWSNRFGYITYPIGPNFFQFKEMIVKLFTSQENFIVIELQGEPWAPGSLIDIPLSEQWKTMDEKKLAENVLYARQVGFSDVYLWGAEWWYWLKEKKEYPALWEEARKIFQTKGNS